MKKQIVALAISMLVAGGAFAQANDTLAKIKAAGSITEGVRESSGLSYTLGNGQYTGFHYDVCANIIKDLEKTTGKKLETKYQPVTSQNRVPLVQNGTVDIECGSTTNNATRAKDVSFAVTTYVEEVRIAVKANSGITSIKDLNGKTVATTTGTTSVQTLRKNERAGGIDFKELYGKDHSDSFLLLESGRADYKLVGEVLSVEPLAIMIRKDDPAFKKAVYDSIKAQIKSGDLAKLWDKWFIQAIPPANVKIGLPLSDATKAAWANPNDKPMEEYAKK